MNKKSLILAALALTGSSQLSNDLGPAAIWCTKFFYNQLQVLGMAQI